jgi:hypothetical protein
MDFTTYITTEASLFAWTALQFAENDLCCPSFIHFALFPASASWRSSCISVAATKRDVSKSRPNQQTHKKTTTQHG